MVGTKGYGDESVSKTEREREGDNFSVYYYMEKPD